MSLKNLFNWQSARKKQGSLKMSIVSRTVMTDKKIFDYEAQEGLDERRPSQMTNNTANAFTDSIIHRKVSFNSKIPIAKMLEEYKASEIKQSAYIDSNGSINNISKQDDMHQASLSTANFNAAKAQDYAELIELQSQNKSVIKFASLE